MVDPSVLKQRLKYRYERSGIQGSYDIHSFRHTANDCSKQFREQRGVLLAILVHTVMAWKEGRGTFITGTIVEKIVSSFYGAEIQVKKKKKQADSRQAKPKRSDEKWRLQNERFFIFRITAAELVVIRGGRVRDI